MLPNQQMKAPVNSPKLVYHPYYGFIPAVAPKKEEVKKADAKKDAPAKMAYVFDPYYGYVPYVPKTEGEMGEKKAEQKFEFDPYFGYVPVGDKKEVAATKMEGEQGPML